MGSKHILQQLLGNKILMVYTKYNNCWVIMLVFYKSFVVISEMVDPD